MCDPTSITIRDLAKLVGLSKTTVARALNGEPKVSAENRRHILEVAAAQGYQLDPNITHLMARLRARRQGRQSVNLAWLRYGDSPAIPQQLPWFQNIWAGALERAEKLGFVMDQVIERSVSTSPERLKKILLARGVVGLLQGPPWHHEAFKDFDFSPFAAVIAGEADERYAHHRSCPDHFHNMGILLHELRARGYKRIGLLLQPFIHAISGEQLVGRFEYEKTLWPAADRLPWFPEMRHTGEALKHWVESWRPDVIVCADNRLIHSLAALGLQVPQDISVAHLNLADDVTGWAGIDQNHHSIGASAVDLLAGQINRNERGKPEHPKEINIRGKFTDGFTIRPH